MNEIDPSDESKPKRRSALRHAVGGLALLLCIGLGMWLLDRTCITAFGGTWRRLTIHLASGRQAVRERAEVGMPLREVHRRIGRGTVNGRVAPGVMFEDYNEGFRVVYWGAVTDDNSGWVVTRVEELPGPER